MLMNKCQLTVLILAALAFSFTVADFEANCELINQFSPKRFDCTIYHQDLGAEQRYRIDVCYVSDGANSICESIVQRFNYPVPGQNSISSQVIIGEPWTIWRQCCQHDALGSTLPPAITPTVGETIEILRSDNYTTINITEVLAVVSPNIDDLIMLHWDEATEVCKLKCTAPADVVFNLDNSGSIDDEEFWDMNHFIGNFTEAFIISPQKTNIGIVLFGGLKEGDPYGSNANADRFFLRSFNGSYTSDFHGDSVKAKAVWDTAPNDPTWDNDLPERLADREAMTYFTQFIFDEDTDRRGYAFLELPISPYKYRITETLADIGDGLGRSPPGFHFGYTAMGTGYQMSRDLLLRNTNRPHNVTTLSNGFPRLIITMADGFNNKGKRPSDVNADDLNLIDTKSVAIGIGGNVNDDEMEDLCTDPATDYYTVSSFEDMINIIDSLVSGTCLGKSNNAVPCDPECAELQGMCTACGTCVVCTEDADCPSCGFCSQSPFGSCIVDANAAVTLCTSASPCDSVYCDLDAVSREDMCIKIINDQNKIDQSREECIGGDNADDFVFDEVTCLCTTVSGDGDGGVTAGAIAGAVAAGALALLFLLALLAALLLLLLLLAVFIIVAVIIAAVVMLAFGVTMAIPPSINGLEVTAPTNVVNDENPLHVDMSEWVESAAQ